MSGKPAARVGDLHTCPKVEPGPVPHVGGPILPPGAATVLIGGMAAARLNDPMTCVGPPDKIAAGAFPVPIAKNPAARQTDQSAHGGLIAIGCPTVLIGLSGTAGNVRVGTAMCNAAANGRTSGTTQQSYNNCGVESSRQVINQATGGGLTEDGLLQSAINAGNANGTPGSPPVFADGGTGPAGRQAILAANGVPSTVATTTAENLGVALGRGQGVIASVDAAKLWGPPTPAGSLHAITVTGVEYDDAGNRTKVIINDTGTGQCGQEVDPATFDQAVAAHPASRLNVTDNPVF
jgi:uncharacterized Zn-binding protein involved in type VI secretion